MAWFRSLVSPAPYTTSLWKHNDNAFIVDDFIFYDAYFTKFPPE